MIHMMGCRIENLLTTTAAYMKYGVLLLKEACGTVQVLEPCDDLGLFFYVPPISKFLNVDPVTAAKIFFNTLVALFVIAVGGICFRFAKNYWGYLVVLVGLWRVACPMQQIQDVYLAYAFPFVALPMVLLATERKSYRFYWITFFIAGIVLSFSDLIRFRASLPVFAFLAVLLLFDQTFDWCKKRIAIALLLVSYAIPYAHFKYVIYERDAFITSQGGTAHVDYLYHPIWHNLYIGFGYLSNPYDLQYDDACGARHAIAEEPQLEGNGNLFNLKLYSQTLQKLLWKLIRKDRYFVMKTVFAKLGVIALFFLLYFGLLGSIAAYYFPKPWYVELAFVLAAGASTIPAILTVPETANLVGFITCTVIYVGWSIVWALNQYQSRKRI